jgi:hypothetical protein
MAPMAGGAGVRRVAAGAGGGGERRRPLASGFDGERGRKDSKGVGGFGSVLRPGAGAGAGGCEGRESDGSSTELVRARL